jgi:cell division protein FtsB
MAKKRKKKKTEKKKLFSKKKIRRLLVRTLLLGLGVGVGLMARPSLVKDPVKRQQVEQARDQLLEWNDVAQEKALDVLGQSTDTIQETVENITYITKEKTEVNPQEVVQTTINNITQEVKELPQEQIHKVKLEFCRDVIEEVCPQESD